MNLIEEGKINTIGQDGTETLKQGDEHTDCLRKLSKRTEPVLKTGV